MENTAKRIAIGTERVGGRLSSRQRFLRTLHYQSVDRLPHMEFGYWASLKDRWLAEGHLPKVMEQADNGGIPDHVVEVYCGCEQRCSVDARIGAGPSRPIETVQEPDDGTIVYRDGLGILTQELKEGIRTIPHYLEFPVKDRDSWQRFRDEFLRLDDGWRGYSAEEIGQMACQMRHSQVPVGIAFGSFIGWIRNWVGFENLAYMIYDDPALVEEMVVHLTQLKLKYLPPLLDEIVFDYASGWEDICYNSGPLLSPKTFRELILPHMKPVMRLLRQHGIDIIFTDTDGNIEALIPLYMEVGLNCAFPLEIKPGNDPLRYRQEYGRDLLILGGFDKMPLFAGKQAVLAELRRLEPVAADGGFIPHIDHRCPDGVDFEIYRYYIREKCHFLGMSKEEIECIPLLAN